MKGGEIQVVEKTKKTQKAVTFPIGNSNYRFLNQSHFSRFSRRVTDWTLQNSGKAPSIDMLMKTAEETKTPLRQGGAREPRKVAILALLKGKSFKVENDTFEIGEGILNKNGKPQSRINMWFKPITK